MCKYIKFKWLAGTVVFIICLACLEGFSMKRGEQLNNRLAAIRSHNKGEGTDWAKLEAECLQLVNDHNSPAEKGEIYATIAFIYSEAGYSRKDIQVPKTIEYSQKALRYPLAPVTACSLYGSWTGALMVTYWSYREEEFVKVRQEAIVPCLTGLRLALDNKAPKDYPKAPPPVGKYDIHPGKGPIYEQAVRKHKQQLAAHKKWQFQEKLYFQRKALTQICVSLYSHKPYDIDELKSFAEKILKKDELKSFAEKILKKYDDVVQELLAQVEAEIARKEKRCDSDQSDK